MFKGIPVCWAVAGRGTEEQREGEEGEGRGGNEVWDAAVGAQRELDHSEGGPDRHHAESGGPHSHQRGAEGGKARSVLDWCY